MGKLFIFIIPTVVGAVTAISAFAQFSGGIDLNLERTITMKSEAKVSSQKICLQDIVEESWVASRCQFEKEDKCCFLNLGGKLKASFALSEIAPKVKAMSFGGVHYTLSGASEIRVSQTARALKASEISFKIKTKWPELEVDSVNFRNQVYVSLLEENDWNIELPEKLKTEVEAKIVRNNNASQVIGWVSLRLKMTTAVYVSKKTIHPMSEINLDDFQLEQKNILSIDAGDLLTKEQFPVGMRAKQSILKGSVLTKNQLEKVPLVKLGDVVTLILRSDNLRISTKGIAQGSAAQGEAVTVQLPRYNRIFRGKVMEGKMIEVWF